MTRLLENRHLASGAAMHALAARLYPICRSIAGDGLRRTLTILQEYAPLALSEIPTGTQVLDWRAPKEWSIREAWIKDPSGRKIVDFSRHNLHVVNFSVPVSRNLSLAELRPHLHSLPDRPDWITYRTSYYNEAWGFCLSHRLLESLEEGRYEVYIDSTLADGGMTIGELYLPGELEDEILISAHCCHPSLANDNLSGIAVALALAQSLEKGPRKHSFRFLFIPGTIGAIAWLAQNRQNCRRVRHGVVLACVGDSGGFTYQRSRRGDAPVDLAFERVLGSAGAPYAILDFSPMGYDTRQYCSPGFDLPVGSLMRSMYGRFPEYHTSGDNLDLIRPKALEESLNVLQQAIGLLERSPARESSSARALHLKTTDMLDPGLRFLNTRPCGEPQLGRRGLYAPLGGKQEAAERTTEAMLWILNLSDGEHSMLDIAGRSGLPLAILEAAARKLLDCELLRTCESISGPQAAAR